MFYWPILCLFSACFFAQNLAAQKFTTTATTSKKARSAYEDGIIYDNRNELEKAAEKFAQAIGHDSVFVEAWLELGLGQAKLRNFAAAETNLETALAIAPDYRPRNWLTLAEIEFQQDKFTEAAEHAERFLRFKFDSPKMRREAARLAENARFAAEAVKNPVPFEPQNVGSGINSAADEYLPSLTADGETMIFTRLDGGYDENFYASQRDSAGIWQVATPLTDINTSDNEGAEAISADGTWLVFTACNRRGDGSQGSCDLYWSQQKGRGWTPPQPFSATINSRAWDAQPCISADGKTLIFSSERPGGQGGKDLWSATRVAGKWTAPQNLGAAVNTLGEEQCPFLHPDGQTLYFTSDGLPGMGNNDLYLSRRQPDGAWGKPENLGFPINTKASEGTLTVSLDGRTAYFAANKPGGAGKNDIYSFDLPLAARPQPVTYVRARVRDAATGKPIVAKVEFVDLAAPAQPFASANTRSDGSFLVCLPVGKSYALNVSKKDYLFASENFNLTETATAAKPFLLDINLQAIGSQPVVPGEKPAGDLPKAGKPVVLRNVFFETGSAALRPESTVELSRLAELLTENPALKIQINGHTDGDGDDASNQKLSENRAQAVLEFLARKGVAAERLRARGFGESAPVAPNDTPEGKAQNRRTEFEVW
ncbi:MAG: OmpA family protein [Saprospiraceae bacterium]